jgi:hypothetical protein
VKIGTKLFSVFVLMEFVAISAGCMGLYIAKISNDGLDTVYKDRVVPLEQLKVVSDMYAVDIVDTSHKALVGAIDLEDARKHVADAQSRIFNKWKAYLATYLVPDEKSQVAEIRPLMKKADTAVDKLKGIFLKQDREALARFNATSSILPSTRLQKSYLSWLPFSWLLQNRNTRRATIHTKKAYCLPSFWLLLVRFCQGCYRFRSSGICYETWAANRPMSVKSREQ